MSDGRSTVTLRTSNRYLSYVSRCPIRIYPINHFGAKNMTESQSAVSTTDRSQKFLPRIGLFFAVPILLANAHTPLSLFPCYSRWLSTPGHSIRKSHSHQRF